MNVEFQRNVDRIAGTFICRVLSLLPSARRQPPADLKPQKLLVILLSEMGSLVLAQPMFERIKAKYPAASLYVLCFRQNKEVLDVLRVVPENHILTVRNDSMSHLSKDSLRALKEMHRLGIDTVLDCELFSRVGGLFSFLSGAKIRAGFHPHTQEGLYRGNFINRPVLYNPYQHIAQQFLTLVEALESKQVPTVKRRLGPNKLTLPPMPVDPDEVSSMEKRFQTDFPQVAGKKVVLLSPGGGLLPIRAWPVANFSRVAEELIRLDYAVGIIGLGREKDIAQAIMSHCKNTNCLDLTGYTKTVRELMLLFHTTSLLIANDGGPGHFASMTPIPAIVLFGPESPVLYGSLDDKSVSLYTHLSCSPCLTAYNHRNSPCDGDNVCLKSIDPTDVLQKSFELLGQEEGVPN